MERTGRKDGRPEPGTAELVGDLERVMATNPEHPGACHYYIHAVEAVAAGEGRDPAPTGWRR